MTEAAEYNATIARRKALHDRLSFLWIAPDGGEYPPFEPGQYVTIGRCIDADDPQKLITRTYSIGSDAAKRDALELFVVHVDDGEFTSWLLTQEPGARLWLSPKPRGGFTLQGVRPGKDLVFVSTGTGIAPYLSMYRTYRSNPFWRRMVLINGVRHAEDLGYRAELEAVAERDENFFYVPLVTREPQDSTWTGRRGRVDTVLAEDVYREIVGAELSPDECHVFLCGNPGMVDGLEAQLGARGFAKHTPGHPGNLHLEKYW